MKKKLLGMIPYLLVLAVDFYLLPNLIKDTGSAIFMLLLLVPAIALICGIVYGILRGFNLWLPLAASLLFTPTIWIFYNESAWVYIVAYGVVVLVGNALGRIFYRKK